MAKCTCSDTKHGHKDPCGLEAEEGNICADCANEKDKTGKIFHQTVDKGTRRKAP